MSRATTHTLSARAEADRDALDRATAFGEGLIEAFVLCAVLAFSAILASAVLRSAAEQRPGTTSCDVAAR